MAGINNCINNTANVFTSTTTIGAGTGITCTLNDITCTAGNFVTTLGNAYLGNTAVSTASSNLTFKKSRTAGVITANDVLGEINFAGHDGTGYINGARITSTSNATIATDRVPADLKFYTHQDTAVAAPTLRLTISSAGALTIATPDAGVALTITAGGFTVTAGATTLTPLAGTYGGIVTGTTVGVLGHIENPTTNGQVLISKSDGSLPIWASLTAGAGVTITPGANTITIGVSGSLAWSEETNATKTIVVNNAYISHHATGVAFTLPAAAAVGDRFEIVGMGAGMWSIAQAANQYIYLSSVSTTVGVGGSITATDIHDCVSAVCVVTDLGWIIKSSVGNLTLA